MHATLRRLKVQSGKAAEVAALIQAEYLPVLNQVEGFVSYTLVDLGDDEISSIGVFRTGDGAREANDRAQTWVAERLAAYVASPLEARDGTVLVQT